jgi:hypothetical protein
MNCGYNLGDEFSLYAPVEHRLSGAAYPCGLGRVAVLAGSVMLRPLPLEDLSARVDGTHVGAFSCFLCFNSVNQSIYRR